MTDLTWILDPATGQLVVEGMAGEEVAALVGDLLPPGRELACARPPNWSPVAATTGFPGIFLRVARVYHGSAIEGPGRRSVVQLQGCPIRCPGCLAPDTHDPAEGMVLGVADVADALLNSSGEPRDGVSILGGEPFAQPTGLLALVRSLRARGCGHILCYSGYAYETLLCRAERQPTIRDVLDEIDMLIDGPYVASLAEDSGPWTGSANQRVLTMKKSDFFPVPSRQCLARPT